MNPKPTPRGTQSGMAAVCTSLAGLILLTGCHREPAAHTSATALAEVNGEPITEAAFRHQWRQRHTGPDTSEAREAMLDRLIERSTLVQQARAAGLDSDPVVVEQIDNLLIRRLEELRLQPRVAAVEVSPAEVEAYYRQHLESRFIQPEQRRLAVLWFNTRGQAPLAARYRPRLEQARDAVIDHPESYPVDQGFGSLAIHNSEHRPSRYKGGDLGWMEHSDSPGFRTQVLRIGEGLSQPGDVSPVVETEQGLFVVRLIHQRPARVVSFPAVESEIRRKLRRARQEEVEERFRAGILQAARVARYPRKLSALEGLGTETRLSASSESSVGTFDPPGDKPLPVNN